MSGESKEIPGKLRYGESLTIIKELFENYHLIRRGILRNDVIRGRENLPESYLKANSLLSEVMYLNPNAMHAYLRELKCEVVTISDMLLNPPKFNYDWYILKPDDNIVMPNGLYDVDPMYLPNFDLKDYLSKSGSGNLKSGLLRDRVDHGVRYQIKNQLKMRGFTFMESLICVMFSYKCVSCCTKTEYVDHICWSECFGIVYILNWIRKMNVFPYIVRDGLELAKFYDGKISTMFPIMYMAIVELSGYSSCLGLKWQDEEDIIRVFERRAEVNLFGRTLANKGVYDDVCTYIKDRMKCILYKNRNDRPKMVGEIECPIDYRRDIGDEIITKLQNDACIWLIKFLKQNSFTNDEGERLLLKCELCKYPSLYMHGAASMSIRESIQMHIGYDQLASDVCEFIEFDDMKIPIKMRFQDEDVQGMYDHLYSKCIVQNDTMRWNNNFESEFLEIQTNNSSGIPPNLLGVLRDEIVEKVEDKDTKRLLSGVRNTRLFDTLYELQNTLASYTKMRSSLSDPAKAGTRIQIGRRIRFIVMVRTSHQVGGFIVMKGMERINKRSPYNVSGKNSNDITDTYRLSEISSEVGWKSSNDVKGMDASTKPIHIWFTLSCIFHMFAHKNLVNSNLFLGTYQGGQNSFIGHRYVRDPCGKSTYVGEYKMSPHQLFIGFEMHGMMNSREYTDGSFNSVVSIPSFAFPSGWWATSAQHTTLGCNALEWIDIKLKKGILCGVEGKNCRVVGGVMGDDQVIGLKVLNTEISKKKRFEMSDIVCNELVNVMNKLGFKCENLKCAISCELLKQNVIGGKLFPLPHRVSVFTSERGDQYYSYNNVKFEQMLSVIRERQSRVIDPDNLTPLIHVLGHMTASIRYKFNSKNQLIVKKRDGKRHSLFKFTKDSILGKKDEILKKGFNLREWSDCLDNRYVAIKFGVLWFCCDVYGAPLPPVSSGELSLLGSSHMTYPSNCINWVWLKVSKKHKEEIKHSDPILDGENLDFKTITSLKNNIKLRREFFRPLNDEFDTNWLSNIGIVSGMMIFEVVKGVNFERLKKTTDVIESYKKIGSSFMDRKKVFFCLNSEIKLKEKYGILIPNNLLYSMRMNVKVSQSIMGVSQSDQEKGDNLIYIFNSILKIDWCSRYLNRFRMSDFDVLLDNNPSDLAIKCNPEVVIHGYGLGVKKGTNLSLLISKYGIPTYDYINMHSVTERMINSSRLPGDISIYEKIAIKCSKYKGDAVDLAIQAMGLNPQQSDDFKALCRVGVRFTEDIVNAIPPRLLFFTNYIMEQLYRGIKINGVKRGGKYSRLYYAYGNALVHYYPGFLGVNNFTIYPTYSGLGKISRSS